MHVKTYKRSATTLQSTEYKSALQNEDASCTAHFAVPPTVVEVWTYTMIRLTSVECTVSIT